MIVLSQRHSGESSERRQSKYKFVIIGNDIGYGYEDKEDFDRVQGHDFLYIRDI